MHYPRYGNLSLHSKGHEFFLREAPLDSTWFELYRLSSGEWMYAKADWDIQPDGYRHARWIAPKHFTKSQVIRLMISPGAKTAYIWAAECEQHVDMARLN